MVFSKSNELFAHAKHLPMTKQKHCFCGASQNSKFCDGDFFKHEKRAQGTVEYLILISVVVVIALIAVGATFFAINPAPLQQRASVEALKVLDVAISETSFNNENFEFFLKLKNNFSSRINITNIKIGDVNTNFDQNLLAGASSIFIISSSAECVNNEVLKDVVITYESKYGLEHLQTTNGISFACNGASLNQILRFFYISNDHLLDGDLFKINRMNDLSYSLSGELDNNGTLPSGLVGYYKFNESSGTTITDSSGNNNDGNFFNGPIITTDGDYTVYTFTSSGVISVSSDTNVAVLVVAGGGGGGGNHGGGGGAGGLVYSSSYLLTAGNKIVTVGSGGNGNNSLSSIVGTKGGNSVFDNITALGGGYGRGYTSLTSPTTGGSGAGGTSRSGYTTGAIATQTDSGGATGYGHSGGNAVINQTDWPSGGGGGAGGVGSNAANDGQGGNGGVGLAFDINGTLMYYAGGGGGGGKYLQAGYGGIGG
jgi:hypothetical protein